jgi:Holliday junction resolvase
MTPEAAFAGRVRDRLRGMGLDTERIENRVNLGLPDLIVGAADRFVMVELKAVTSGLKVGLRPHQIAFLVRHAGAGRPCFVLVHYAGTASKPAMVFLYHGRQAIELATEGLRLAPLRSWPSRTVDWLELADLLSGKIPT